MKCSPKIKKIVAIFLLVNILQSVILPSVAHALTSGPTAPESSSFEPIDTTDMVNLQTGDFTYSIPLLEVPSPEGGYPLALAYHGGVRPLEEASWVGLGWSLSPGAISRVVSGYPDDQVGASRWVHDRWNGGETKSFSVGTTIGVPGVPVGLGLSYTATTDTYKGFSGDMSFSMGANYGIGPLGASIGASYSTNNGTSFGYDAGLNVGANLGGGAGISGKLGVSSSGGFGGSLGFSGGGFDAVVNSDKNGTNAAVSNGIATLMVSKGLKPSFSAAGMQIQSINNNYGVSTKSFGFTLPIPVPWGMVNLGYHHRRYWIDARDQTYVTGSLQTNEFDSAINSSVSSVNSEHKLVNSSSQQSFDRIGLFELTSATPYGAVGEYTNPAWLLAGAMPSFDAYQVTAQGLSGSIRPYIFNNYSMVSKTENIMGSNGTNRYNATQYHRANPSGISKIQFRFDNDFSNSYTIGSDNSFTFASSPNVSTPSHTSTASTPASTSTVTYFNSSNRTLAGSKHVDWFSNADINAGTATTNGFINYAGISSGDRTTKFSYNISKQIGGYSITNEGGVTYHYALPVYAYDEVIDATISGMGETTNNQSNPHPYAYTWLLTAITGPDFVDRGGSGGAANGLVDENDWGYWVSFDYGRWVDNDNWRLPATGTMRDVNGTVKRYSFGRKELYYLDAIKTRTHTALFVKDIRKDGKGVTSSSGGFTPQSTVVCIGGGIPRTALTSFPLSTLRLSKIMLFKNETLQNLSLSVNTLKDDGNLYDQVQVAYPIQCGGGTLPINLHTSDNVIDVTDIQGTTGTNLTSNSLKIVELDNDYYDLCPSTPNSLDNASIYSSTPSEVSSGKLTLKSVKFKGKGGVDYLPPLKFYYDYQNPTSYNFTIAQGLGTPGPNKFKISVSNADANLKVGDIIKHNSGNWYATISETTTGCSGGTCYNAVLISGSSPATSQTGSFIRTKNPPFSYHKLDFWGNYKCDFTGDFNIPENDFRRRTTKLSKNNLDAWSLRSVETSLGGIINVEYEPRVFYQSAFGSKKEIENIYVQYVSMDEVDVSGFSFNVGDVFWTGLDINLVVGNNNTVVGTNPPNCTGTYTPASYYAEIMSINTSTNTIRVKRQLSEPSFCPYYTSFGFIYFDSFILEAGSSDVANADGIRVKNINVQSPQFTSATEYTYIDGVTSYIPSGNEGTPSGCCTTSSDTKAFIDMFRYQMGGVPEKSLFTPSPGTLYKQVEVRERINNTLKPEYRKYTFTTFTPTMVDITRGSITTSTVSHTGWFQANQVKQRHITVADKTAAVGTLEKLETYNSLGQLVSKTENNYLYGTDGTPTNQGVIHQEFNELWTKETDYSQPNYGLGTVTKIKKYPYYLASTTSTSNGITNTTYNRKYDLLTGEPTEVESMNSFGQNFLSRSIPAYNKYSEMGPKISNSTNKNMLTQPTATYLYKSNGSGTTSGNPIQASVTTWTDNLYQHRDLNTGTGRYAVANPDASKNIYHQNRTYVWKDDVNPDGTAKTWTDFDWTLAGINAKWIKTSEATLYDRYSHALEEKNINDQFASAKMDYKGRLATSVATNARYNESVFSGAEDYDASSDYFGGEVKKWSGTVSSTYTHTGHYSLQLNSGQYGFIYRPKVGTEITKGRTYRVRVWVYDNGGLSNKRLFYYFTDLNGSGVSDPAGAEKSADQYTIKAGSWVLLEIDIPIGTTTNYDNKYLELGVYSTNGSTGYFDDFRFHPIDGAMTSFVYDKDTDLLTYILDSENMYTQYIYDSAGRLTQVYRETTENPQGKRLLSKHEYHYARPTN